MQIEPASLTELKNKKGELCRSPWRLGESEESYPQKKIVMRSTPGEAEPVYAEDDLAGENDKDDQENGSTTAAAAGAATAESKARLEEIKERVEQKEFEQTLETTWTAIHDVEYSSGTHSEERWLAPGHECMPDDGLSEPTPEVI